MLVHRSDGRTDRALRCDGDPFGRRLVCDRSCGGGRSRRSRAPVDWARRGHARLSAEAAGLGGGPTTLTRADRLRGGVRGRAEARTRGASAHWAIGLVLSAYVAVAVVLPTRANLVMYDDFVYIRQAREFAHHLVVRVPDQAAGNAVFEILWGGTFGAVFGTQLWVFRLATLVLSLLSGLAMFGLCRELGCSQRWSAGGAALLLFNPLYFVLSYSFMTDPHLVALLVIATYGYVRGLREPSATAWTIVGSAVASLAYRSGRASCRERV